MCLDLNYSVKDDWTFGKRFVCNKTLRGSQFAKHLREVKEEITCWKVYRKVGTGLLRSAVRMVPVDGPGTIISDRTGTRLRVGERKYGVVDHGIHVFTDIALARAQMLKDEDGVTCGVVVPVICKKKDLVAQGQYDQAVFTKVRIEKRVWDKIFLPKK